MAALASFVVSLLALLVSVQNVQAGGSCWAKACFDPEDCEDRDCEVLTGRNKYTGTHGVLQSCQSCKLRQLPSLRKWLREEQKFNEWENLRMEWIQGHNPDLVIVDKSGREKERIDLTNYNYETMDTLLTQKGFARK
eukprot:INCI11090.1.p1 GENE.INCI11090.1~~INCI11090.1.p1  ORF type:complete len:137 (-),score=20.87 INCI11090.1:287-697(-)